jgi:hypothetical protein
VASSPCRSVDYCRCSRPSIEVMVQKFFRISHLEELEGVMKELTMGGVAVRAVARTESTEEEEDEGVEEGRARGRLTVVARVEK